MKKHLLALIFFLFSSAGFVFAQTGNNQNSLLPEIDPQDIEIRSEFRARFPGIRRQPILGFNPTPRIFRIDPNRVPFMESDKEAVASIALTRLDRPAPPAKSVLNKPSRTSAFVKAGFGSFITPELDAYLLHKMQNNDIISVNADFTSSDGHLDNQDSGFRFFDVNGIYGTKLKSGANLSFNAGIYSDFNHLFELSTNVPNDNSGTAQKEYQGATLGVILENNSNSLEGWKLYASSNLFSVDLLAPNSALRGEQSEQFFNAGYERKWAGKKIYDVFSFTLDVKGANYSAQGLGNTQWISSSATIGYKSLFNYVTEIELDGGLAFISDGFRSKPLFVFDSYMNHNIQEGINLFGAIYTRPEIESVWQHHQTNPFLNSASQTQFHYTFGVDAGMEFQPVESTKFSGAFSFNAINNYGFYSRSNQLFGANTEQTFYQLNYANASIFKLELTVSQQLVNDMFWFDGLVYAQRPELKNGGDIPFKERLGAEGAFRFKPADAFTINTWAQYIGEREDPLNTTSLDGFVLVNAEADYKISKKFGVYFKVLNILGQKYELWDGYEERPFQVYGGIKLTF